VPSSYAGGRAGKDGIDRATKDQAKKLFADGMIQYDLRKFDAAVALFEKAFQLMPDPAFLFNIAQAHRQAGHTEEAIGFYRTYLRKLPEAANAGEVREWIDKLGKAQAAGKPQIPAAPPAMPYLEPKSKYSFQTRIDLDGKPYALTGVGTRSYIGFLIYGVAMYVEDAPARMAFPKLVAQAGGSELAQLRSRDLAQNFIVLGEFGKAAMLHFVRDVSAGKIRDSYRDMLKENLKSQTPPTLRKNTEDFLALFKRDMKGGEDLIIRTTLEGQIELTAAGTPELGPKDPTLCIDLWNLWLGPRAISPELKQGLVERIQALGTTVTPAAPPSTSPSTLAPGAGK
jgi:tetratricopeptide (TPR) repeat protein